MADLVSSAQYTGSSDLVHLHNHTIFSALDGVASPEQYAEECLKRGYPAMSATEHGHMASVPDMHFAFRKHKIKYIPGCFKPDQPIMTEFGVREISSLLPKESVYTHSNKLANVVNTQARHYCSELVRLRAWCVEDQVATPEHPFLVREVTRNEVRKGVWEDNIKIAWVKAGDIFREKYWRTYATKRSLDRSNKCRYRFYLCVPRLQGDGVSSLKLADFIFSNCPETNPSIRDGLIEQVEYAGPGYRTTKQVDLPVYLDIDNEFLWVVGLWLVEGSLAKGGLEFSLGSDEYHFYERVADYFGDFGITAGHRFRNDRKALDVTVYSSYFNRLFESLFGSGFANKQIPTSWINDLSGEQADALLEGLLDGDAKRTSQSSYLKLNNRSLVWQARMLMTKLDIPQYSAVTELPCNNSDNISYCIRKRESGHFYYDYDDDYLYLPVYDVLREEYHGQVHNLEVETDNSYNTGVAVHNCEIYYNDYEPIRQQFIQDGGKIKRLEEDDQLLSQRIRRNRHITILCKNEIGFHNLIKLTTLAYEFGFYYAPRVWFDKLCEYKEGLIVLSGCLNSPIAYEIRLDIQSWGENRQRVPRLKGRDYTAADYVRMFKAEFGEDFFLEVQMPCIPDLDDDKVFRKLIEYGDQHDIKVVLANDAHYIARKDFQVQKVMMAVSQGRRVDDPDLFYVNSDEQYMKTRAELWATFRNNPYSDHIDDGKFNEICDNTLLVAERCEPLNPDTSPKIPDWTQIEPGVNADKKLREAVAKELIRRGLHKCQKKYVIDGREVSYVEQSKIELDRFINKGFASYFLITQDLLQYGHKQGWPFGPRGSAGGSLVCFLLGIHDLDPLKWDLSFDRFMASSRGGYMLNVRL